MVTNQQSFIPGGCQAIRKLFTGLPVERLYEDSAIQNNVVQFSEVLRRLLGVTTGQTVSYSVTDSVLQRKSLEYRSAVNRSIEEQ
jgi:hypothetical protein